jgi:hypothetical protein
MRCISDLLGFNTLGRTRRDAEKKPKLVYLVEAYKERRAGPGYFVFL